jgi:deazaflavin-dependent oxidoreductase (nitroreductase family)
MGWAVVGIVALWTAFVLVLRLRIRPIIDGVRVFNKRLLNPVMLRFAGQRHWYAAVLEHTGRHTGRAYKTPVVAEPTDNGFVIPLPYGERVDWLRNVLAVGHATITAKDTRYTVDQPQVVDRAVAEPLLPPRLRRSFRLYGIDRFLLVRTHATPESVSAELAVEQSLPELAAPVQPTDRQ